MNHSVHHGSGKKIVPGIPLPLKEIPLFPEKDWRHWIFLSLKRGDRIGALFAHPEGKRFLLIVILIHQHGPMLEIGATKRAEDFQSLANHWPQAKLFEREIYEEWGLLPTDHPWLKPVRFPQHRRNEPEVSGVDKIGRMPFFTLEGEEVHEVGVGPVHAGIIEPGHFRFQCAGEIVKHLEISLGYQHRGIEKRIKGRPGNRHLHYLETIAGDSTVAHAIAGCEILEGLGDIKVEPGSQRARLMALELERLANHCGDLGAISADVGFQPTAAYCGALRGDFLNLTAMMCGNRFGRSWIRPGGVRFHPSLEEIRDFKSRLKRALSATQQAAKVLFDAPSVIARFEEVGRLTQEQALELGVVGPVARSSGVAMDCRHDFPSGAYRDHPVNPLTHPNGDVFSRTWVRIAEIEQSGKLLLDLPDELGVVGENPKSDPLRDSAVILSLVEGWRGEVVHCAITDAEGGIATYKIIDPSFRNWLGLAMALRNQQISDFPLCNKSFNLSYCGFDL